MKHIHLTCIFAIWLSTTAALADNAAVEASRLLETAGVQDGLIVHLGCGDGKLTAALRANDSFIVSGVRPVLESQFVGCARRARMFQSMIVQLDQHGWQSRSTDEEMMISRRCPKSGSLSVLRLCHPCGSWVAGASPR